MYLSPNTYTSSYNSGPTAITDLNAITHVGGLVLLNAHVTLAYIPVGSSTARVSLWGRNLLNNTPLLYAADLGTTVAGNFQAPRSLGVDVGFTF